MLGGRGCRGGVGGSVSCSVRGECWMHGGMGFGGGLSAGFARGGQAVVCVHMACMAGSVHFRLSPHTACPPPPLFGPGRPPRSNRTRTALCERMRSSWSAAWARSITLTTLQCTTQRGCRSISSTPQWTGWGRCCARCGGDDHLQTRCYTLVAGRVRKPARHSEADGHTGGGVVRLHWYPQPMSNNSFEILSSESNSCESRHHI